MPECGVCCSDKPAREFAPIQHINDRGEDINVTHPDYHMCYDCLEILFDTGETCPICRGRFRYIARPDPEEEDNIADDDFMVTASPARAPLPPLRAPPSVPVQPPPRPIITEVLSCSWSTLRKTKKYPLCRCPNDTGIRRGSDGKLYCEDHIDTGPEEMANRTLKMENARKEKVNSKRQKLIMDVFNEHAKAASLAVEEESLKQQKDKINRAAEVIKRAQNEAVAAVKTVVIPVELQPQFAMFQQWMATQGGQVPRTQ